MKRYIKSAVKDVSDDDVLARINVAQTTTRPELLGQLSWDYNPSVRESVAENYNTPEEVLQRLTSDSDPWVANDARATLIDKQRHGKS